MEWRKSIHEMYEVSECGNMRVLLPRYKLPVGTVLRGSINGGYRVYRLQAPGVGNRASKRKVYTAHRLVLFAFVGPPPSNNHQCAHWDGDRLNNHYTNLRWATPAENTADKARHGNLYSGNRKLSGEDVLAIRGLRDGGATYDSIRAVFNISKGNLSAIINRKTWRHI